MSEFRDHDEARVAVNKALAASNLSTDETKISIHPFQGINGKMMDLVAVHFPGGWALGSYSNVLGAIRDSTSFEQLSAVCIERTLAPRDAETGELPQ